MSIHEKLREMLDDWHESATNFEGDQDWPHRIAALLPEPEAPSDAARKEARSPAPGVNYVPLAYASQAVHAAMAGENQKAYRLIDQDVRCMPEGPSEYERGWQAGYAEAGCQIRGETTYTPSDAVESVEGERVVPVATVMQWIATGQSTGPGGLHAMVDRHSFAQPTPTPARLPWVHLNGLPPGLCEKGLWLSSNGEIRMMRGDWLSATGVRAYQMAYFLPLSALPLPQGGES